MSFLSPRPVAISRLKIPVCPTIVLALLKCKEPRLGFELGSL